MHCLTSEGERPRATDVPQPIYRVAFVPVLVFFRVSFRVRAVQFVTYRI